MNSLSRPARAPRARLRRPTLGSPSLDRVYAVLALLALGTIWLFRYPAGVDLPQHANILRILADYSDPATGYAAFYERQFLTPYFVTYLVALPFAKLFGALVAVKITLSIAAVATPWALVQWLRAQGGEPWWGLFGFPLTFGFGYHWGFLSFVFALPLVLGYLVAYRRLAAAPDPRRATIAALWALLVYACHGIGFAIAMLTAAGQAAVGLWKRPSPRALVLTGAHFVPAGLAALFWQLKASIPGIGTVDNWPPQNERFLALLSGELTWWPTYPTIAVGAGFLLVMFLVSRPAVAAAPERLVPLVISLVCFVLLPETVAGTWLVGMRMLVFVHVFATAAFNPGVHGRRLTRMRALTTLLVLASLVGHGARMRIFNYELRGLTPLIAAIPPHADVRGLVTDTDHDSEAFGGVLGQTPAWVTAANAGFLANDSGGYFQLPIQRPHHQPWIADYRWFVARGGADTQARVTGLVGPVRVVKRADDWWLFESRRPPIATGGLEVVRYLQEWGSLQADRSMDSQALRVAGAVHRTGLGTHALSRIQVRVTGRGEHLRGEVGIDDGAGGPTEVVFKILDLEGKILFESPPMVNGQAPVPFSVSVPAGGELLLTAALGPHRTNNNNAHADWLDLRVE